MYLLEKVVTKKQKNKLRHNTHNTPKTLSTYEKIWWTYVESDVADDAGRVVDRL